MTLFCDCLILWDFKRFFVLIGLSTESLKVFCEQMARCRHFLHFRGLFKNEACQFGQALVCMLLLCKQINEHAVLTIADWRASASGNEIGWNVTNKKNGVSLLVKNVRVFNWFISEAPALPCSLMTSQGKHWLTVTAWRLSNFCRYGNEKKNEF